VLAWGVAASILVAVGVAVYAKYLRPTHEEPPQLAGDASGHREDGKVAQAPGGHDAVPSGRDLPVLDRRETGGLTARARAEVSPATLAVGQSLQTGAKARRRVALPDGSILYLNQQTSATLDAPRQLTVHRGEVFVEVAPRYATETAPADRFVVRTPGREIVALGTKFDVQVGDGGTGVVVTQGKVQVSGIEQPVAAGERLAPEKREANTPNIAPAPRASHLLDWTRDLVAAAESRLVPISRYAGGALVVVDPAGQEMSLSLRKYHVDVYLEDGWARTTIDQTFFNHQTARMEGTFYFPLPPDASLSRLAMYVNGKLMEGGMVERERGRQVFEEIVRRQKDPALLEWMDGSTFKMRVFPLEGRQEKRIVLSYTQRLPVLYDKMKYRFPAGHSMGLVDHWSCRIEAKGAAGWRWTSDTHDLKRNDRDGNLVLEASADAIKPDRDLELTLYDPQPRGGDRAVFSTAEADGQQYLMLRWRPDLPGETRHQRRDWVFLFESSADRDPLLARVQIDTIRTLLENAERDDTFLILSASTQTTKLNDAPQPATPDNVREAIRRLEKVHLIGALDLDRAFSAAAPLVAAAKNPCVVHIGSGLPSLGTTDVETLVRRLPERAHYVGIGVGKRWSRALMRAASARTGGLFTQINPDDQVTWRAFDLLAALNAPRLSDVRVVDKEERLTFLRDQDSIGQGEELAAVARFEKGQKLPEWVEVTGRAAGKSFVKRIAVENVRAGAGYLPRTWAKWEIDRLVADGAEKNRSQIVPLSMGMYVMSPFTSLLVLETEEMYAQYKVDRGRKDHWAMYPCPQEIPVVTEPVGGPAVASKDAGPAQGKPSREEVLRGLVVRISPPILQQPGVPQQNAATVSMSVWDLYHRRAAIVNPVVLFDVDGFLPYRPSSSWNMWNEGDVYYADPAALRLWAVPGQGNWGKANLWMDQSLEGMAAMPLYAKLPQYREGLAMPGLGQPAGMPGMPPVTLQVIDGSDWGRVPLNFTGQTPLEYYAPMNGNVGSGRARYFDYFSVPGGGVPMSGSYMGGPMAMPGNGIPAQVHFSDLGPMGGMGGYPGMIGAGGGGTRRSAFGRAGFPGGPSAGQADPQAIHNFGGVAIPGMAMDQWGYNADYDDVDYATPFLAASNVALQNLAACFPRYVYNDATFRDVVSYAPGLNTSSADVEAALEAASDAPALRIGRIDPAARKLIDAARKPVWQRAVVRDKSGRTLLEIDFDTAGRYRWQRTLAAGLDEEVVCDGETLVHLYRDLGLGARRQVSRFHRGELARLVPWLVPSAEDLAIGADVVSVDERTIALVPLSDEKKAAEEKSTDEKGEKRAAYRVEMVFAPDGRLAERRLIEAAKGKLVLRQTCAADGTVRWLDAQEKTREKTLLEQKLEVTPCEAPELHPKLDELVILPLPLRTLDYLTKWQGVNEMLPQGTADDAVKLLAAYLGRSGETGNIVASRFARGDRRLGFYTLLLSAGYSWDPAEKVNLAASVWMDPRTDHPGRPLSQYVVACLKASRGADKTFGGLGGPAEGFWAQLAEFHDLWLVWHDDKTPPSQPQIERTGLFFKRCKQPVFAWALWAACADRFRQYQWELPGDWVVQFKQMPGLAFAARYQVACTEVQRKDQAKAELLFRTLYLESLNAGFRPPLTQEVHQAFVNQNTKDSSGATGQERWGKFVRDMAARLTASGDFAAAIRVAWEVRQLGDPLLAEEVLSSARIAGLARDPRAARMAVAYLLSSNQSAAAATILKQLLDDPRQADDPSLWWSAATAAQRQGMLARAAECLDRAVDLEFQRLPPVVNVAAVRQQYSALLNAYRQLAAALPQDDKARQAAIDRVVRAADRWRSLDSDPKIACDEAAKTLTSLGASELAWQYAVTALVASGSQPNWAETAKAYRGQGQYDLADRAYGLAAEGEPANAQLLWDRAAMLLDAGRDAHAREVFRRLADGHWDAKYADLVAQARRFLEAESRK
jgi:tetratricopeptide (TPR) repeat protein